ncbi:hypothetical protein PsorP6_017949 [Peronosclerospora sorghi]|uniref:Uncharacterized protein n=1 Tax=Peronosclerospora sorghi TaxID=230839 RepID=A0ACC0WDL0_9STRA|nr:hypothetical protein PsorP6_017949 [Peronosclerospora sorghi]
MVENQVFVMNGPYVDCTLQRNHLAQWLYRSTGRYAVKTRHTVVYMRTDPAQDKSKYVGIYLLLEKPTYDPKHLHLASMDAKCAALEPKILSGGWAWANNPLSYGSYSPNMVVDQYQNEFGMGERPVLAYPKGSTLSQQMRDAFVNTTTGFLPQLYRTLWHNMTAPLELAKHVDLGSFADYFLHTEMSLNVDAYRRSTFYFKDRDQPINAGPVWDLNLAYGNGARRHFKDWIFPQYTYWKRLMCHSQLTSLVIQRWKTLRGTNLPKRNESVFGAWSDASITAFLTASTAPVVRQLAKCKGGDWRSDVVQCAFVDSKTCHGTYMDQIMDLRTAVLNRAHWMDEKIEKLYKRLNAETCSGVGALPNYNCGLDGNDDGCLSNAEKYYNAVPFPPVRQPYAGASCQAIVAKHVKKTQRSHYERTSVDYCWKSAGIYVYPEQKGVKDKSLTLFCSGYGTCKQGVGATCNCTTGIEVEHPSCRRIDAENEHYARMHNRMAGGIESTIELETKTLKTGEEDAVRSNGRTVARIAAAAMTLLVLGTWLAHKYVRREKCRGHYTPVRYGSMQHARIFQS